MRCDDKAGPQSGNLVVVPPDRLGGDCATQGAGNDTLSLGKGDVADVWIFVRHGKRMEILNAINHAQPDEIPQLAPGPRQWLLEQQ